MGLEVFSLIEPIAEQWDALADRIDAQPWLRPGWIEAWFRSFGTGLPTILVLRRDDRLAAVLPLERRRGGALRAPANWHTPGFGMLAEDDATARELARELYAHRPRSVSLAFVSDGAGLAPLHEAAAGAGYRRLQRTLERSPYVAVDGDWERYEQGLGRRRLKELARRRRRLEEQGEVTFTVEDGGADLDRLLDEGFAVEAAGWKGERGTAISSAPETRRFYTDVARWAAARGWLRLVFLRLDGRAIAFELNIEAGRVWYDLKDGHLPEFRRFAPGSLVTHEVLRHVFARDVASYEFLGEDEAYKLDWTTTVRQRLLFQSFAPTASGLAEWGAWAFARPAVKSALRLLRR
jgi:CelD/BcsL family acetyltransferase involved in cellulose biosynthesis